MRCLQCGRELKENNKYCPGCGAKVEHQPVQVGDKKAKKKKLGFKTGLLIGIIIAGMLAGGFKIITKLYEEKNQQSLEDHSGTVVKKERGEQKFEGEGFETPEEAVTAYLDAMKQGDVKKMLSTFAIETYVANYNIDKVVNRIGGYSSYMVPIFRNTDIYTQTINAYVRQHTVINEMIAQYFYLAGMEDVYSISTYLKEDGKYNKAEDIFNKLMDPEWIEKLSDLEYEEVVVGEGLKSILSDSFYSEIERDKELQSRAIDEEGADDIVYCAVKIKLDDKNYYFCPDLICYSGKWYILNLQGAISPYFGAVPMSGGFYEIE